MTFPPEVIRGFGYSLGVVQFGGLPGHAKPWRGAGSGVFELSDEWRGDAYRVVYVVRFRMAIYVLHCFQKKSPSGIRTAKSDVELAQRRLRMAEKDHEERYGQAK